MRKPMPVRHLTRAVLMAGSLLALSAGVAHAQQSPITYNINQQILAGTVTGQIQTDGKTGTLTAADFLSWNLTLSAGGATTVLTSVGGQSKILLVGGDVSATKTQLLFNYGGSDTGYLVFQAANPGFGSGQKYYCDNTTWYGCGYGASVVPQSYNSATAQYDTSYKNLTVIAFAGPSIADEELGHSVLALAESRMGQVLINELQSDILNGLNEQVSCSACASAGVVVGSADITYHGRKPLSNNVTVMGGINIGKFRHDGVDVSSSATVAGSLQFDAKQMGHSRPYADIGFAATSQTVAYRRNYTTSDGAVTALGSTHSTNISVHAQLGWVNRLSPRDELAGNVSFTRAWQHTGGYVEQAGDDPFAAVIPGGTDAISVRGVNAQYTHLFGRSIEFNLNGGLERAYNMKSGVNAEVNGVSVHPNPAAFSYAQMGGRIGIRLNNGMTLDLFANRIQAPHAIGSSTHGGFDVRWHF